MKAVTSMATFSLVYNILHTTPTHHHQLSSSVYWMGSYPVLSLFPAHIVTLLLLLVAVVARSRETLPGPDDFR